MRMKKFLQLAAVAAAMTLTLTMGVSALADSVTETVTDSTYYGPEINYKLAAEASQATLDKTKDVTFSIDRTLFVYQKNTEEVWNREQGRVEIKGTKGWQNGGYATITVKNNNAQVGVKASVKMVDNTERNVNMDVEDEGWHVLQPSGTEGDTLTVELKVVSGEPTEEIERDAGWVCLELDDAPTEDLTTAP